MMKKVYGAIMEMYTYDKDKMVEFLNKNNGDVFEVLKDNFTGKRFISFKYYVKKVE
jgi:hypothetical protein